jgi:mannose-1-phosphate guanylyltransferase
MGHKRNSSAFDHAYAVILAGGSGTRFWPLSRRNRPKQLLHLFGRKTLLEQTAERIHAVIPWDRTYVYTNTSVRREVARCLAHVPSAQIIAEPAQRNTAPTIGLAAQEILRRDPEGIMVVLPSDHLIANPRKFLKTLGAACRWATDGGRSVVIGVRPTRAETGYGYVRLGGRESRINGENIFRVHNFTEKPSLTLARRYVASGRYLWNAGMFVWRASTLLSNLQRFQPRMAKGLEQIAQAGGAINRAALKKFFPRLEKISVDFALMERISKVSAIPGDFGWNDVGSWAVVYELQKKDSDGNVRPGNSLALDSRGNVIVSEKKAVVAVGVRDLVVVETIDALLVCARERAQDVGKAVAELERRGLRRLL